MAESSGFFRSVNDRKYTVDWLAKYIAAIIGNGVYKSELAVTADGSAMSVTLPAGRAWINGYHYRNDGDIALAITNADGVLHRKDTVILRWDVNERSITAQVLTGTPASNPIAPDIVRTVEQYDLKIAEISIPAGTTAITQALITDTRLNNNVCGIVHGVVDQVDTTTLYNQIQADLAHFQSVNEENFTTWSTEQQADYEEWFAEIKGILGEDEAGNLLNLINEHKEDTNNPHGVTAAQLAMTSPANLILYVSPSGSDDNDGLTVDTPLLTLQKALSYANPWTSVDIRLADGTYGLGSYTINHTAYVSISSISQDATKVIINGCLVVGVFREISISYVTINTVSGKTVIETRGSRTIIGYCTINGSTTAVGLGYYSGSTGRVYNTEINNAEQAVYASQGSLISVGPLSGSGNTVGLKVDGGIITNYGAIPAATTPKSVVGGGMIIGDDDGFDYEEGTLSNPRLQNGLFTYAGTYTILSSRYVKNGKKCHVSLSLKITAVGTGPNMLISNGLPLSAAMDAAGSFIVQNSIDTTGGTKYTGTATLDASAGYIFLCSGNTNLNGDALTVGNVITLDVDYIIS